MRQIKNRLFSLALFTALSTNLVAAPTVYMPLGVGNKVIAIDASKHKIVATYSNVMDSHGLVATPGGEYLIAGSFKETPLKPGQSSSTLNSQLYKIHPGHGHVMSKIPVAGGTHHQAITPNGNIVISTHVGNGNVSLYDVKKNKITQYIKTGFGPNFTVISKDGKTAYVSNTGSNNISELDLTTLKVTRTFRSGPSPAHMALSNDGKTLFVTNPGVGKVNFISTESGKIIKNVAVGGDAHGLDISADGKTLFTTSKKDNKFIAIDIKTNKKTVLDLSPAPYHLNTIKGTNYVYVSSRKKPLVWVVDQKTIKVIAKIKLPAGQGHQMATVK